MSLIFFKRKLERPSVPALCFGSSRPIIFDTSALVTLLKLKLVSFFWPRYDSYVGLPVESRFDARSGPIDVKK